MAVRNRFREGYAPNDEYYTPPGIFEALGVTFDLDVCAPENGNTHVPASAFYHEKLDGLACEWYGNVWMNPPYSRANPWHEKFLNHNRGIALVQVSRNKSFVRLWQEVDGILLLPHNFKFVRHDGSLKEIFMPVALVSLGASNTEALQNSGLGRMRK